jgi:hypothetical protein
LDKDFNIIGETLFPDYTYKSVLTFIAEDGLYICDSHVKNPEFDENKLSFQCFELVKNDYLTFERICPCRCSQATAIFAGDNIKTKFSLNK